MREVHGGGIVWTISLWLGTLAIIAEIINLASPLPSVTPPNIASYTIPAKAVSLAWPSQGQSAIGAKSFGLLSSNGTQKPAPIASVAKVITALAVLKQKPLDLNSAGPTLTMTQTDVDNYTSALSEEGSFIPVTIGEQISERQALEGMLLPSANNMARSLAQWAFGSLDAYTSYANNLVKTYGMTQTTISDASGFAPTTVSTANDLVKLGLVAMNQPTLAQIVAEPSAQIPVAGQVQNINTLLGQDGIIGIKTGNTDQAGGCFLFAAQHSVNAQNITIVGAVVGAPTLSRSMTQARSLIESVDPNFVTVGIINAGKATGNYKTKWGAQADVLAKQSLSLTYWSDQPVLVSSRLNNAKAGTKEHSVVGSITAQSSEHSLSVPLVTRSDLPKPSIWWRLTHP